MLAPRASADVPVPYALPGALRFCAAASPVLTAGSQLVRDGPRPGWRRCERWPAAARRYRRGEGLSKRGCVGWFCRWGGRR